MTARSDLHLYDYKRLTYNGTAIYVQPEKPDWFIPSRRADMLLDRILNGASLSQATRADSQSSGCRMEESFFLADELLSRISTEKPAEYTGRADYLSLDHLRECWFHITNRCNLNCRHCMFCSGPEQKTELEFQRLEKAVEQAYELGCNIFYFTGGEPFVYPGFTDICDKILSWPKTHVVILTNGIAVERFSKWLENADNERLHFQVSLDGLKQTNDLLRGAGTFDKVTANMKFLTERDFAITLSTAVTRQNVGQMKKLVSLAGSLDVKNVHFMWLFRKGNEHGEHLVSPETITEQLFEAADEAKASGVMIDNIEIIKSQLFSLAGTKYDLNNAGWSSLAIGPDGMIYPSPALVSESELAAGGIDEGLASIWRESSILDELRNASLVQSEDYMANPLKFIIGGGDIDHSYVSTGEFTGGDPYVDIYNRTALKLLSEEAEGITGRDNISLACRMGERLYQCSDDMGEVTCGHSNCVLSLPGADGHSLVNAFYSQAAENPNEDILNPVHYDEADISHIPEESRIRSYGCGSPVFDCDLEEGQVLVDFGSGTGIECFIAARQVGPKGKVIGVDMSDAMLSVANRSREKVTKNLGFENIEFVKAFLEDVPVEDNSVDVVISNCVINLSPDKRKTFREIHRILKPGGRLVISDIVRAGSIPLNIKYSKKLRGECIGGAFEERELFGLLADEGLRSGQILKRFLYREVEGYNFFSVTYSAVKPAAKERKRLMYTGPFRCVMTDEGHLLPRGVVKELEVEQDFPADDSVYVLNEKGNVENVEQASSCCCSFNGTEQQPAEDEKTEKHTSGCMVCGKDISYLRVPRTAKCYYCGLETDSSAICAEGHFVCDKCHSLDASEVIEHICLSSGEIDMLKLMNSIRQHDSFPLHGPEHHILVPAVILSCYRNRGGQLSDEQILAGVQRGSAVVGGSCGFLGICGAATGVGIAFSVIKEANPLNAEQRQLVQKITADVLTSIASHKAPRCCQRDCWIALREAARLSKQYLDIELKAGNDAGCSQSSLNKECIGRDCPLWQRRTSSIKTSRA